MTSVTNIGLQPPAVTDTGLVGNLNVSGLVQAGLEAYEQPITDIENQQSTNDSNVADYQTINSDLASLQTAAQALSRASDWQQMQATSSDSTVATATAESGTPAGSISFVVGQLAAAQTLVSAGSVASTSDVVDDSPDFLLSQGGAQLGFSALASDGLALGQHTVQVTQASQAALTTGTADLSSQSSGISVGSGTDTVDVTVGQSSYQLTLAASGAGGYSGSGLLAAVQSAISAAGASGVLQAGYNSSGQLVLSTVDQGSSQSLQVTGGSALATLGLSVMSSASTGVDAIVKVDGTSTDLSTVTPGATVSLGAPTGSVSATVASAPTEPGASLLQGGSLTATDIATGNGSLSDLVSNINAADTGITASAVASGPDAYVLQLTSSQTGSSNDMSVDMGAFAGSSLGSLQVAEAGADAQIKVGGTNGYTLSSATNTFSSLLPGLSVTVAQTSSSPVTVSVTPDTSALAGDVGTLVSAANTVLSDVQKYAGYDEATNTGGPLMGSATLQDVTNQVQSIVASATGTSTLGDAQSLGITLSASGTINFDQSTFEQAFNSNPQQVAAMFTQGGTFDPTQGSDAGQVTVSTAETGTQSGSYGVTITQSAAQAVSTGSTLGSGTVSTPETLTIAMGGTSVDYTTTAGESLSSVASGIDAALAQADLSMSAEVVGGTQLQLESDAYGGGASFSVSTTATGAGTTGLAGSGATPGQATTFTGTDVAGSIDGVTATGSGQFLTVPITADSPAAGLSLMVTASGITSSTNLGSLTYSPGIAQSLANVGDAMSNPAHGSITATIKNLQNQNQDLNTQLEMYQNIAAEEQKSLTNQYDQLETTLEKLSGQSTSLTSALDGLSTL